MSIDHISHEVDPIKSRSSLDIATLSFLAEEKNGGYCSILVNNIITDANTLKSVTVINEVYDYDVQDFVTISDTANHVPSISEHENKGIFGRRKRDTTPLPNLVGDTSNQREFRQLHEAVPLQTGVTATLGFNHDSFGVLVDHNSFIPLLKLVDQRGSDQCSYADPIYAPLGELSGLVMTSEDEKNAIVRFVDDQRGSTGFVMAEAALSPIEQELRATLGKNTVDGKRRDQRVADIFTNLDVEGIVSSVLGLDTSGVVDYRAEQEVRDRLELLLAELRGGDSENEHILHETGELEGTRGSATNYVIRTVLERTDDGENSLAQFISFPNANDTNPSIIRQISLGQRIGRAMLVQTVANEGVNEALEVFGLHITESLTRQLERTQERLPDSKERIMLDMMQAASDRSAELLKFIAEEGVKDTGLEMGVPSDFPQRDELRRFATSEAYDRFITMRNDRQQPEVVVAPVLSMNQWRKLFSNLAYIQETRAQSDPKYIPKLRGEGISISKEVEVLLTAWGHGSERGRLPHNRYPESIVVNHDSFMSRQGIVVQAIPDIDHSGEQYGRSFTVRLKTGELVDRKPTIDTLLMQLLILFSDDKPIDKRAGWNFMTADASRFGGKRVGAVYSPEKNVVNVLLDRKSSGVGYY